MEIKEGQVIDGLFKITKRNFSRGAAGEIHLAQDPQGRIVVLKFLLEGGITRDLNQFKKEYQTVLKFSHPHVARVHHFGEQEGHFFIVYEFVDGGQFHSATIGLTPEQMVPLFIQGLEGLEAIHTLEMLHLDIKSSNVLATKDLKVKIIDFGISMAREDLKKDKICGSPQYMAPEMILKKGADTRADLFSFGCLMYKCVTGGRYPYPLRDAAGADIKKLRGLVSQEELPAPPSHFGMYVPEYLDEIVLKLLAREPDQRFGSARAVINALKTHHPEDYIESPEALGSYLIPEGDRHIGRTREQGLIEQSLDALVAGHQPPTPCVWIRGRGGMGKTHLLRKIKERAEKDAEKVFIHFLELPKESIAAVGDETEWLEAWLGLLEKRLSDNEKPILILIDNVDRLFSKKIKGVLSGLLDLAHKKTANGSLFRDTKPLLLCFTSDAAAEEKQKFVEVELTPFSVEDVLVYLKATPALRHKEISTKWAESLCYQTGGSPKELKATLKEKDSKGVLFDLNGEILVAQLEDTSLDVIDEEEVPQVMQQRLTDSLTDLFPGERECLEWMAVWCWQGILTSLRLQDFQAFLPGDRLLPTLNRLTSKGLIVHNTAQNAYSFSKYSYLPVLIYQKIETHSAKQMHQKIDEHLKALYHNEPEYQKAILLHQALGGLAPASFKACLHLGRKFLYEKGNASFAKKLFQRIFAEIPLGNIRLHLFWAVQRIEACYYSGDYEEAKAIYKTTLQSSDKSKVFPKVLKSLLTLSMIPVFIETHQFHEAQHLIDESLELSKSPFPSRLNPVFVNFKARLLYNKFYLEKGDGQKILEEARQIYEESERMEAGLHPVQKDLVRNNDLGIVLHTLGDHPKAIEKLHLKLKKLEKNPNIFIEFVTLVTLAEANRFLKKYDEAFDFASRALENARQTRQGKWIQYAHQVLACMHQAKGFALKKREEAKKEYALALKENSCCLAASVCLENRKDVDSNNIIIFIRKGQCYQELGEWSLAETHFDAALHYQPSGLYLSLAYLGLGECYAHKAEVTRGREFLERSLKAAQGLPKYLANHCEFNIQKAYARCHLQEKNLDAVATCLKRMKGLAGGDEELLQDYKLFETEIHEKGSFVWSVQSQNKSV